MHQVIASPQGEKFVIARPGARKGMQIPRAMHQELAGAVDDRREVPGWLADAARQAWGIDLAGQRANGNVLVRPLTPLNYSRATWEINKGCNFNCEHCYLAERKFEGLPREEKERLLLMLRDAGVLWLQFTGGEPTIDRDFAHSYRYAYGLGMLIEILTNGSRLHRPDVIELLSSMRPHKVAVSLYGATAESFDSLTRKPGAYKLLMKGIKDAKESGIPLELVLIITKHNAHEIAAMREIAEEYAQAYTEYSNISPTYDGSAEPLAAQAPGLLDKSTVFQGCPAGHTFFHVDPHGFATMCKIGRENPISLMAEGLGGLLRLPDIADAQMLRSGGCSGCQLSASCRVCRPLAKAYQEAKAPLNTYCQHGNGDDAA
ncbi:radical SAM protein [Streptomyces tsukubensis]|uniref:Radical SAM protein n=1 Tax=Streptomyces tsukubensis TaxID=83656 RepID=A0A1V3ZZ58_9ACTN|nr:radical SAM protein [Streptomyces tsukubensis]OON70424.1 radical SAM protein [Streptomyces tsukubensis]QFR94501.1 radical SAM protein [Streptomyces tsukubensis]